MKAFLSKIPKVWLAVFCYFLAVEILVLIFQPSLLFSKELFLNRLFYATIFFILILFENKISRKYFQFLTLILIYAGLSFLYRETATLNQIIFPNVDATLMKIDGKIFGFQPSIEFSEKFNSMFFSELMFFGYFCYYLMPIVVMILILKKNPSKLEEFGFIFISSFFLYYLIFILIPAIGPQFYFSPPKNSIESKGVFGTLVKFIQTNAEVPTAAFPSSHVGISVIVLIWIFNNAKNWFKFFLPFTIILIFSTVYIKAHYAIDSIAGMVSAPIIYVVVNRLFLFANKWSSKFQISNFKSVECQ